VERLIVVSEWIHRITIHFLNFLWLCALLKLSQKSEDLTSWALLFCGFTLQRYCISSKEFSWSPRQKPAS